MVIVEAFNVMAGRLGEVRKNVWPAILRNLMGIFVSILEFRWLAFDNKLAAGLVFATPVGKYGEGF